MMLNENTYKIPFDHEIPKDKEVFPRAPLDELVFKLIWNTYQHTSFIYENSVNVTLLLFNSDRRFATRPHPLLCTLKRTFTISRIPYNTIGTSSFQLHLKSGDIHPNPGPHRKRSSTLKYPCGECQNAVRKKQDVILFAEYKTWFHAKCIYMDKSKNENTKKSTVYWKNVFKKWANERNLQANLEECESDVLVQTLSQFYAE
ncbi:hypothetical protein pdam_00024636 [Pocillopora damicornis]|uniref:PARP-type domain-containing protein n=1 Tax=Pocillopora damicornis TaxID=46731 RepID=A0A3M6TC83_POCDA|nr:hypothetical protein pdam_00024636 [Pocillopora damicornis]